MAPLGHWARPSESKTVDQKSTKWIPWVSQRATRKAAHGPQDHFTSKWFLKRDTIPFGMRWLSVGFFAAGKLLSTETRRHTFPWCGWNGNLLFGCRFLLLEQRYLLLV